MRLASILVSKFSGGGDERSDRTGQVRPRAFVARFQDHAERGCADRRATCALHRRGDTLGQVLRRNIIDRGSGGACQTRFATRHEALRTTWASGPGWEDRDATTRRYEHDEHFERRRRARARWRVLRALRASREETSRTGS